jgi:hypothetical protein
MTARRPCAHCDRCAVLWSLRPGDAADAPCPWCGGPSLPLSPAEVEAWLGALFGAEEVTP